MEAVWKEKLEESAYRMGLAKAVKECRDEMLPRAREMAAYAVQAFSESNKSQLMKLERQAISTMAITDIYDYIKLRVGRSESGKKWRHLDFGRKLLLELEGLEVKAEAKAKELVDLNPLTRDLSAVKREMHLLLAREFIGQMVSNYLYFLVEPKDAPKLDMGEERSRSNQLHQRHDNSPSRSRRR